MTEQYLSQAGAFFLLSEFTDVKLNLPAGLISVIVVEEALGSTGLKDRVRDAIAGSAWYRTGASVASGVAVAGLYAVADRLREGRVPPVQTLLYIAIASSVAQYARYTF